jgi:hypothetical protein
VETGDLIRSTRARQAQKEKAHSDPPLDVRVIEETTAWIQIHTSRLGQLIRDNNDPSHTAIVIAHAVFSSIIDAASIYAEAAAEYPYARRQQAQLPTQVSWDEVRHALATMQISEENYPELQSLLTVREQRSRGPFERLSADSASE